MEPHERIIVALDVDSMNDAVVFTRRLLPHVGLFKVGLELLTREGAPEVVRTLQREGAKIFYDGKFMDIPNTVAGASRAVAKLGVDMFNVHASGGIEMVRKAVENKGSSRVLAVTVLTSFSSEDVSAMFNTLLVDKVLQLAHLSISAGADGLICSPVETHLVRSQFSDALIVTPGVRPTWAALGDQKRVMTPGKAIENGADYLVIGRPIIRPPKEIGSSVEAAKLIAEEIGKALQ